MLDSHSFTLEFFSLFREQASSLLLGDIPLAVSILGIEMMKG